MSTFKKSIAIVTPWPPQTSGIADYAYELASCMIGPSVAVHIITNERAPVALPGAVIHHVDEILAGELNLANFDAVLVQLGNHPNFHGYMQDIIKGVPCIVELHDLLLHHCVMGDEGMSTGGQRYYEWLARFYGPAVEKQFRRFLAEDEDILRCPIARDYPCSDVIVASAAHVIVHSEYAKRVLRQLGMKSNVSVLNLCQLPLDVSVPTSQDCAGLRIGVFGGVQRNRQIDAILSVLGRIEARFEAWSLDVVGSVEADCENLLEMPHTLGIGEKTRFHGRLALGALETIMRQCDIVVSLRNPTMGETSGVVTRAMQMGIPVIVSDVGWYSELPPCVLKIDNGHVHEELEKVLWKLLTDAALREELALQTLDFASRRLDMRVAADDILLLALHSCSSQCAGGSSEDIFDGSRAV
ncbi:glycosyltransferase involved in cell wall biosynthesis [Paraburkholderia atlantica]|uniref:glycosyltransferase family 4 protein n=1 Tax=Paraburkholderia atlantica TaxID=2654982 RepID=UPI003D1B7245